VRTALGVPAPARTPESSVPASSSAPAGRVLRADDLSLLWDFYESATKSLQAVRHKVRALPEEDRRRLGLAEPAYPPQTAAVLALRKRLSE